jgi:uncharacterized repeat protein (TIGR03803 family)
MATVRPSLICGSLLAAILFSTVCVAAQTPPPTLKTLYNFTGGSTGASPQAGVVIGSGGVFYGTTSYGGTGSCSGSLPGCGTVFSLNMPTSPGGPWTETVLYSFIGGSDGAQPDTGLVIGKNGVLYGTTRYGGMGVLGSGTVFSLTPPTSTAGPWTETVVYRFIAISDGFNPNSVMVVGSAGVLYGTTQYGGIVTSSCLLGCGTVFSLKPPTSPGGAWTEAVLHAFTGYPSDGAFPFAGVAIGKGNVLYGTTFNGGVGSSSFGTVFNLKPPTSAGGGWTESVLYSFTGGNDGFYPYTGVMIGSGGVLYGTAYQGGASGYGTVFSLTPPASAGGTWTETALYNFTGGSDGGYPYAAVAMRGGVLYGTTRYGGLAFGLSGYGTVFSLTPPTSPGGVWTQTVLHTFTGGRDGSDPDAGVVISRGGVLYGTTHYGGSSGDGTVFALKP